MTLQTETLKVVKDRVAVLIGTKGKTKKYIEEKTFTRINIESKDCIVTIKPIKDSPDPLNAWKARDICKAISRGFSPERAYRLLADDEVLEIISIANLVGKNPKTIKRIKSRLIGENGKTRTIIEESTGVFITIYGDTIGLIGTLADDSIKFAKKSISMIIEGLSHSTVYNYLQKKRRILNKAKLSIWKTFAYNEEDI